MFQAMKRDRSKWNIFNFEVTCKYFSLLFHKHWLLFSSMMHTNVCLGLKELQVINEIKCGEYHISQRVENVGNVLHHVDLHLVVFLLFLVQLDVSKARPHFLIIRLGADVSVLSGEDHVEEHLLLLSLVIQHSGVLLIVLIDNLKRCEDATGFYVTGCQWKVARRAAKMQKMQEIWKTIWFLYLLTLWLTKGSLPLEKVPNCREFFF